MKIFKITSIGILVLSLLLDYQPIKTVYKKIENIVIYNFSDKNIYMATTGFMIDADGSPTAYNMDDNKALDYLDNAGKPGNWWAIATDTKKKNGNPLIQKSTDPAPGYYISMTALVDKTKKYEDPNRYINSSTIPYIAIPFGFAHDFKLGDIALVINKKSCYAIVADIGPKNKFGEGSIYLAEQLAINSSPKSGGTLKDVVYILFKNSGNGKIINNQMISKIGKLKLTDSEINDLLK